jgi:hypothetical protein
MDAWMVTIVGMNGCISSIYMQQHACMYIILPSIHACIPASGMSPSLGSSSDERMIMPMIALN